MVLLVLAGMLFTQPTEMEVPFQPPVDIAEEWSPPLETSVPKSLPTEPEVSAPPVEEEVVFATFRASISGTAVDQHGAPVSGAVITVFNPSDQVVSFPELLETDVAGRYHITNLNPGTYRLSARVHSTFYTVMRSGRATITSVGPQKLPQHDVSATPHATVTLNDREHRQGVQLRLNIAQPDPTLSRTINGTVANEQGESIPNAEVYNGAGTREQLTVADDEGRFSFAYLKTEHVYIRYSAPEGRVKRMTIPPGENETIILVTELTPVIEGAVIDGATGKPIADYRIRTDYRNDDVFEWRNQRVNHVTDPAGRFSFAAPYRYPAYVDVYAPGYVPSTTRVETEADAQDGLKIELTKGPGLTGVITGPNGNPVADALVYARPIGPKRYRFPDPSNPFVAVSAGNGAYSLTLLDPDMTELEVSHLQFATTVTHIQLIESETVHQDVQLVRGAVLEGVLRVAGEPVAEKKLYLRGHGPVGQGQKNTVTDADGHFRFNGLLRGSWYTKIEFEDFDHVSAFRSAKFEERIEFNVTGEETIAKKVEFANWNTVVIGQLEGVDKVPDRLTVRFDLRRDQSNRKFEADAVIYPGGSFRIEKIPPGEYDVDVNVDQGEWSSRRHRERIHVYEGESVEMVIPFDSELSLTAIVTCPDNIEYCTVKVVPGPATAEQLDPSGSSYGNYLSGSSKLTLDVKKSGLYTVIAVPKYTDPAILIRPVYAEIDVQSDQPNEVELKL